MQRRWFRVDGRPGHESLRTGLFTAEAELVDVIADPAAGVADDEPLVLVCAHGRHDTCCAVRGRPLAAALAADLPERTWEASHVGGCRFAAAMVLLPHGVVLGNVAAADGPKIAAGYAAGQLPERGVRGRASLSPVVQAAQHHARMATGEYGVDALRPVDASPDEAGSWHVRFADPEVTIVLRERRVDTDRRLTCAATAPGWMRVFDLLDVARRAAAGRGTSLSASPGIAAAPSFAVRPSTTSPRPARASRRPWRSGGPRESSAGRTGHGAFPASWHRAATRGEPDERRTGDRSGHDREQQHRPDGDLACGEQPEELRRVEPLEERVGAASEAVQAAAVCSSPFHLSRPVLRMNAPVALAAVRGAA